METISLLLRLKMEIYCGQGNFEYIRYSYLNDLVGNQLTMIDPSGGPYLTIGSNMGLFDESFKGLFIKGFSKTPEGYLIITKE